jgi:hypothetical protein
MDGIAKSTTTSVAIWQGIWENVSPIERLRVYPDPTYPSAEIEAGTLISFYGIL